MRGRRVEPVPYEIEQPDGDRGDGPGDPCPAAVNGASVACSAVVACAARSSATQAPPTSEGARTGPRRGVSASPVPVRASAGSSQASARSP